MSLLMFGKKKPMSLPIAAIGITLLSVSAAAFASGSNGSLDKVTVEKVILGKKYIPYIGGPFEPAPKPWPLTTFTVRVPSGGCTDDKSYKVETSKNAENGTTVTFTRIEEDNCEAYLPHGTLITLSVLGHYENIRVANPLLVLPDLNDTE